MTELFLDIENIDAVLGFSILEHKPAPFERPDFGRLLPALRELSGASVSCIAVMKEGEGGGEVPRLKFARFLERSGARVVWAETFARRNGLPIQTDVVDDVLDHLLTRSRAGTVIAGTHDGHVADPLSMLKERGARVGLIGFREFLSNRSAIISNFTYDLEFDLGLFGRPLPRLSTF